MDYNDEQEFFVTSKEMRISNWIHFFGGIIACAGSLAILGLFYWLSLQ